VVSACQSVGEMRGCIAVGVALHFIRVVALLLLHLSRASQTLVSVTLSLSLTLYLSILSSIKKLDISRSTRVATLDLLLV